MTEPGTCHDAIAAAGAEYLGAIRDGKVLELTFYAPSRAEIRLHLDHAASHINLQDSTLEPQWDQAKQELSVTIPRGASPTYLRQVRFQLVYPPHAPAIAHEAEPLPAEFGVAVTDTIRLPLGPTTFLAAYPPLIAVEDPKAARVVFEAHNPNHDRVSNLELVFTGAYRGSGEVTAPPRQTGVGDAMLKPSNVPPTGAKNSDADSDGILHGELELRVGKLRDHSQIAFVPIKNGTTTAYRYDLDGDGAKEWMLENTGLRLIVSPESGGRALALVDKVDGFDLFSSVGAMRDNFSFTPNPSAVSPERARGRYGLFNRAYDAEWSADGTNTALRLHYHAADIFPHGADIEKTIELDDIDALHVTYRVALRKPEGDANSKATDAPSSNSTEDAGSTSPSSQPQSFVAVESFPTFADGVRVTRLCWSHHAEEQTPEKSPAKPNKSTDAKADKSPDAKPVQSADAATDKPSDAPKTPADAAANPDACQDFAPGAAIIEVPPDANHLELRTPARPGVVLDWDAGAVSIEPHRFSALVRITYPPFAPGAELKSTIRFHVLPVE